MVLAYVTLGAALAPDLRSGRLLGLLAAYLLGLGGGAHFLDEARGHPWGTGFSTRALYAMALLTLAPAMAVGLYFARTVAPSFLLFVLLGTFFALAYNLEWFGGAFHTDFWFAVSWAALPFLTSYYLQALDLPLWAFAFSAALAGTAGVQIALSRWIKGYRRGPPLEAVRFDDGTERPVDTALLIGQPQRALKCLVLSVDLLAAALLLRRLL